MITYGPVTQSSFLSQMQIGTRLQVSGHGFFYILSFIFQDAAKIDQIRRGKKQVNKRFKFADQS